MRGAGGVKGGTAPATRSCCWVTLHQDRVAFLQTRLCRARGGLSPFVGSSSFSADVNGWDVVREPGLPFGCEKLNVDCYFPPPFSGELLRSLRDFFRNNTHTHGAPVHFRLRLGIVVGICALHTKNRKLQFADLKIEACCYLQLSFS